MQSTHFFVQAPEAIKTRRHIPEKLNTKDREIAMEMNDKKYEELMLRFAKELHDVGVTQELRELVEAQYKRHPNVASCSAEQVTDRFQYRFGDYLIEAHRTVDLKVRKVANK